MIEANTPVDDFEADPIVQTAEFDFLGFDGRS